MRISNSSLLFQEKPLEGQLNDDAQGTKKHDCDPLCEEFSSENRYVLDWILFDQTQHMARQYEGTSRQELVTRALSDITELIFEDYALSSSVNNDYVIEVANVDSLKRYSELFDFLTGLSAVNAVTLLSAKGKTYRFCLQLLGTQKALLASLKLNKKLKQHIDPLAEIDHDATPVFYWETK